MSFNYIWHGDSKQSLFCKERCQEKDDSGNDLWWSSSERYCLAERKAKRRWMVVKLFVDFKVQEGARQQLEWVCYLLLNEGCSHRVCNWHHNKLMKLHYHHDCQFLFIAKTGRQHPLAKTCRDSCSVLDMGCPWKSFKCSWSRIQHAMSCQCNFSALWAAVVTCRLLNAIHSLCY